jgi:hypothetical protein
VRIAVAGRDPVGVFGFVIGNPLAEQRDNHDKAELAGKQQPGNDLGIEHRPILSVCPPFDFRLTGA